MSDWRPPDHVKQRLVSRAYSSRLVPLRMEKFTPGGSNGVTFHGAPAEIVRDCNHKLLCEVLGLDPEIYYFDMPSSFRGVGSMVSGAGGSSSNNRTISGYVIDARTREPYAKLSIVRESDVFRDSFDPSNSSDFWRLDR